MSGIVPVTVPDNFSPKSFWKRPEGKPGMLLLLAIVGFVGFVTWGTVVPFVLATISNTFWLGVYLVAGYALADVIFGIDSVGKSFRNIGINIFKSLARAAAWTYTTIDPIGILKNTHDSMIAERGELGSAVEQFSGTEQSVRNKIEKDQGDAEKYGNMGREAQRRAAAASTPLERQKWEIERDNNFTKAGLLMGNVEKYKKLLAQISTTLHTFQSWCQLADGKISKTKFIIDYLAEERKSMIGIQKTMSIGKRLLKGDDEQQKMWDMAVEYLAEDAANTVGQMREVTRFTDQLVTQGELENAAAADAAAVKFSEFSKHLLSSQQDTSVIDMIQIPGSSRPVYAPAYSSNRGPSNDIDDLFRN